MNPEPEKKSDVLCGVCNNQRCWENILFPNEKCICSCHIPTQKDKEGWVGGLYQLKVTEIEQIDSLMRALIATERKKHEKPEWSNEVEVLSIAGNLEQVVKKMIAEERDKSYDMGYARGLKHGHESEREHLAKEVEGMMEIIHKHDDPEVTEGKEAANEARIDILVLLKN